MARNRMIKSDFWSDEKLGTMKLGARLLFIGMWTFADDVGVVRGNKVFLRNSIFPYDEEVGLKDLSEWLTELREGGHIVFLEHHGEAFYFVRNFPKHQKINRPSTFRFIEGSTKDNVAELFISVSTHGGLTEGSLTKVKEKEKEKVKEKVKEQPSLEMDGESDLKIILDHWNSFPDLITHRETESLKAKAQKRLSKQLKIYSLEEMKQAVSDYSEAISKGWWSHKWTLVDFLTRDGAEEKFYAGNYVKENWIKPEKVSSTKGFDFANRVIDCISKFGPRGSKEAIALVETEFGTGAWEVVRDVGGWGNMCQLTNFDISKMKTTLKIKYIETMGGLN